MPPINLRLSLHLPTLHPPARRPPTAPSTSLLRFLKSQTCTLPQRPTCVARSAGGGARATSSYSKPGASRGRGSVDVGLRERLQGKDGLIRIQRNQNQNQRRWHGSMASSVSRPTARTRRMTMALSPSASSRAPHYTASCSNTSLLGSVFNQHNGVQRRLYQRSHAARHNRTLASTFDRNHKLSLAPTHRFFSTSSPRASWWNPWKGASEQQRKRRVRQSDLPPLSSFLDEDRTSAGRLLKQIGPNELRLRCSEYDGGGNVVVVDGEYKKTELIAKFGLLPRDLRKIDSSLLPHILVRPSAILINLLHLHCLIKHDRVLVFDAYGSSDSYAQSVFLYDLEGKLRQKQPSTQAGGLPYEFRALEAVLVSVTTGLESEFEGVREPVVGVLRELEEDIDRDKLRYLLIYSKKLGTFEQKARLVRDALDELLEADDDLAAMYLSEKANGGKGRSENEHTEVEMLLESYHKVTDEIVQAAENLVSNIRNTEEIVKAILDANRNSLMLLELKFSIWTLGLGAGTFIAALYGMNLKNFFEESDLGFLGISSVCGLASCVAIFYGVRKLRRVQRFSMWGERDAVPGIGVKRGGWKRSWTGRGEKCEKGVGSGNGNGNGNGNGDAEKATGGLGKGTSAAGLGPLGVLSRGEARMERLRREREFERNRGRDKDGGFC
ncbi:cora-domain-containing protein [Aulographum hederae CBS 113979]|uniref:Mitochondrial inner membrane magnesium transporter MRS2 n=1 Tax=Aulographum hederae CBS 113979 TaxID=1176131 RepID=A0A6G1HDX9_9PEZI|nr:cora-domain-containing protein [Aulographum hederae CBS 113979]